MPDAGTAATLALTQSVSAFTFFLPKISDVRKTDIADANAVADIRTGEVAGLVVCLGTGAVCASLSRSSTPVVVSAIMALIIIALYESILRRSSDVEQSGMLTVYTKAS
jgi:hypothetical protein